jgi:hypothetical protein
MNCDGTEFIDFISHRQQIWKCSTANIDVAREKVGRVNKIKYLGIMIDTGFTFKSTTFSVKDH